MSEEDIEIMYTLEHNNNNILLRFIKLEPENPNKYVYGVKLEIYYEKDVDVYNFDQKNMIGFHTVYVDKNNDLHGSVAILKSFTSEDQREKEASKGLGKFMLCALTRYIVDTYDISIDRTYYGLAGAGTPYFDNELHQIYHPEMCQLTGSEMKELIFETYSKSGRKIEPVLSEKELQEVIDKIEHIDVDSYDELKMIGEKILESDKDLFIKTCIETIYPTTWKDIQQNWQNPNNSQLFKDVPIEKYYESIMCEIIATHRLFTYYRDSLGFEAYHKKDGRLIRMKTTIKNRLEKCDMTDKMY